MAAPRRPAGGRAGSGATAASALDVPGLGALGGELSIESFFPADAATAELLRAAGGLERHSARVAYDEDLAGRIRELIGGEPDVSEQAMFGGLALLIAGNGWLRVDAEGVLTTSELEPWVRRGVAYARSLPPKR